MDGWNNAATVNGTVTADYTLSFTPKVPSGAALDYTHKKLYVRSSSSGTVSRFGYTQPSDLNGTPVAELTLSPPGALTGAALFVYQPTGALWSSFTNGAGGNGEVCVINSAHTLSANSTLCNSGNFYFNAMPKTIPRWPIPR